MDFKDEAKSLWNALIVVGMIYAAAIIIYIGLFLLVHGRAPW